MAGSIDSPSVRQLPRRLIGGAAVLACLGIAALAIDVPVATWMRTHRPPREITRLLNFSEAFAHGTGVAVFLIAVVAIDPSLRPGGRAGGRDWSNFVRMVSRGQRHQGDGRPGQTAGRRLR